MKPLYVPSIQLQDKLKCFFSSSSITTTKPFELIHIDVWGPYRHVTHDNYSFFLTLVVDFTRAIWIYLIQSKDQSVSMLKHFYTYVDTRFRSHIQSIHSDNAKELCGGEALQFYLIKESFTKNLLLTPLNKTGLSNANTVTFYKLQEHCAFNLIFQSIFGGMHKNICVYY